MHEETMRPAGRTITHMPFSLEMCRSISCERRVSVDAKSSLCGQSGRSAAVCRLNNPSAYLVQAHPFNPSPERGELYQKRSPAGAMSTPHPKTAWGKWTRNLSLPHTAWQRKGRNSWCPSPTDSNPENAPPNFSATSKSSHATVFCSSSGANASNAL